MPCNCFFLLSAASAKEMHCAAYRASVQSHHSSSICRNLHHDGLPQGCMAPYEEAVPCSYLFVVSAAVDGTVRNVPKKFTRSHRQAGQICHETDHTGICIFSGSTRIRTRRLNIYFHFNLLRYSKRGRYSFGIYFAIPKEAVWDGFWSRFRDYHQVLGMTKLV